MTRLYAYHCIKQFVTLFPTPVFLILSLCNIFYFMSPICGGFAYEMALMWFLMALAHARPWIEYVEIKRCPNGCGRDYNTN
jgi:hypothetical protein